MQGFNDGTKVPIKSKTFAQHQVIVTPELASKWLGTQVLNRNVQKVAMLGYRADMIRGLWHFAGDPIRFDVEGHLIDGQNRLEALAGIDIPNFAIPFVVQTGLPAEAQMVMDQGARRTAGQQLYLKGIPSGSSLAAGVRLMWRWEDGKLFDRSITEGTATTNAQVVEWIDTHRDAALKAVDNLWMIRSIGLRPSPGITLALRLGPEMANLVQDFYREMHTLENLPKGSPTLTLAQRLRRVRQVDDLVLTEVDHLGFLVQTWNSWVNGKTRTKLQRPKGGWSVNNFPNLEV